MATIIFSKHRVHVQTRGPFKVKVEAASCRSFPERESQRSGAVFSFAFIYDSYRLKPQPERHKWRADLVWQQSQWLTLPLWEEGTEA